MSKIVTIRVPEYIDGESLFNGDIYIQEARRLRAYYTALGYQVFSEVDEIENFDPNVSYTVKVHLEC